MYVVHGRYTGKTEIIHRGKTWRWKKRRSLRRARGTHNSGSNEDVRNRRCALYSVCVLHRRPIWRTRAIPGERLGRGNSAGSRWGDDHCYYIFIPILLCAARHKKKIYIHTSSSTGKKSYKTNGGNVLRPAVTLRFILLLNSTSGYILWKK